jgi:hypothetical protein
MKGRELRADILVPELYGSQVIEIVDSEGEDSLRAKAAKYEALGVVMLPVKADFRSAVDSIKAANGLK